METMLDVADDSPPLETPNKVCFILLPSSSLDGTVFP